MNIPCTISQIFVFYGTFKTGEGHITIIDGEFMVFPKEPDIFNLDDIISLEETIGEDVGMERFSISFLYNEDEYEFEIIPKNKDRMCFQISEKDRLSGDPLLTRMLLNDKIKTNKNRAAMPKL